MNWLADFILLRIKDSNHSLTEVTGKKKKRKNKTYPNAYLNGDIFLVSFEQM